MSANQKIVREIEAALNACENITEDVVSVVAPQDEAVVACIKRITGMVEYEINALLLGGVTGATGATGMGYVIGSSVSNLGVTGATGLPDLSVSGSVGVLDDRCCRQS